MRAERDPERLILIGMMGSGKTTIGRLLAEATGWPYVDNDELVRQARGSTAREVLAADGEHGLRRAESDALALALDVPEPAIVGIAAGAVLSHADRDRLRDAGTVVWLRADPATLAARAAGAAHRPWLDGDATAWFERTAAERDRIYDSLADITVDTGRTAPAEAVAEVLRAHPAR